METTDSQLLPYPEPDDFADASLQLKLLAEAVDAKLYALELGYNAILTRPTIMKRTNPGATVTANIVTNIDVSIVAFQSPDYFPQQTANNISFETYPAGIWLAGCYLATNPTGVVNAGSHRITKMRIRDRRIVPGTGITVVEDIWDHSGSQTNTGGDFCTFTQSFEVHDPENARLTLQLFHGNTSSTLSVTGGFLWVTYIGELAN